MHRLTTTLIASTLLFSVTANMAMSEEPQPQSAVNEVPKGFYTDEGFDYEDEFGPKADAPFNSTVNARLSILEEPLDEGQEVSSDKAKKVGLLSFHEVVKKAKELAAHDKIKAKVWGKSVHGRQIFTLTVTNPSEDTNALQQRLNRDPKGLRNELDSGVLSPWKQRILISANIHGDEPDGTEAVLSWVEFLATANPNDKLVEGVVDSPTVGEFLDSYEVVVIPSVNPDGRVAGERRNGAGIDLNRDHIAASQPETRAVQAIVNDTTPVVHLDFHGYFNTSREHLGLIEPAGEPHSVSINREVMALRTDDWLSRLDNLIIENPAIKKVNRIAEHVGIAKRDMAVGRWDDWAPIYTATWSATKNGMGATVEAPFNIFYESDSQEHQDLIDGNAAYFRGTIDALALSAMANKTEFFNSVLDYKIAGANNVALPSQNNVAGWVIRDADQQHSKNAIYYLVQRLLQQDIVVEKLPANSVLDDGTKAAFFVPAAQPNRNLAYTNLNYGARVPANRTTDISVWSIGALWGADVREVTTRPNIPSGKTLHREDFSSVIDKTGDLQGAGPWYFYPRSTGDISTINAWLKNGVKLLRSADGKIIIPRSEKSKVDSSFHPRSMDVYPLEEGQLSVSELKVLRFGVTWGSSVQWLKEAGFEAKPFNVETDNFDSIDVLLVDGPFNEDQSAKVKDWVQNGGAIIYQGFGQSSIFHLGLNGGKREALPSIRTSGLISAHQEATNEVLPNRLDTQIEWTEPFAGWTQLPVGFFGVQNIPEGTTPTHGLWRENEPFLQDYWLTIAGNLGSGRIVATDSLLTFRHHTRGQLDELFDMAQWATQPKRTEYDITANRVGGKNRVETAVMLSQKTHPVSSNKVVLASGDSWSDSLVAGAYASSIGAPVLLVNQDGIPSETMEEMKRLKAKEVIIIGGTKAVSPSAVDTLLNSNDFISVRRLSGSNRYETAVTVSREFPAGAKAVLATGDDTPDALSASVLAARSDAPVLLSPKNGAVPETLISELRRLGLNELRVLGGTKVVSDEMGEQIRNNTQVTINRIAGKTRYETAVLAAQSLGKVATIGLANASSTIDPMLATNYLAKRNGAILLTDGVTLEPINRQAIKSISPEYIVAIGGEKAVSSQILINIENK